MIGNFYFPHLEWCSQRLNTFIPRGAFCVLLPCLALTLQHVDSKKFYKKRKWSNPSCGAYIIVWVSALWSDWFIIWVRLKHQQTLQKRTNTSNYRLFGLRMSPWWGTWWLRMRLRVQSPSSNKTSKFWDIVQFSDSCVNINGCPFRIRRVFVSWQSPISSGKETPLAIFISSV